MANSHVTDDVT